MTFKSGNMEKFLMQNPNKCNQFIIFILMQSSHVRKDFWQLQIPICIFFTLHFIHEFGIQLVHQVRFCFTNSCQIKWFQTTNTRIRWLIIVDKYQFVQIVSLKPTSPTLENIHLISIQLIKIPKICLASAAIVGNCCFSVHHHVKAQE